MLLFLNFYSNLIILNKKKNFYIFIFSKNFYIIFYLNYTDYFINKNLNYLCVIYKHNLQQLNLFNFIVSYNVLKFSLINKNFKLKKTNFTLKFILMFSHFLFFLIKKYLILKVKKNILLFVNFRKNYSKLFNFFSINSYTLKGVKNFKKILYKKIKL